MAETLDEATRVRVALPFHTVLGLGWSKRNREVILTHFYRKSWQSFLNGNKATLGSKVQSTTSPRCAGTSA